jgi:putative CocE/NonD family hydrolase
MIKKLAFLPLVALAFSPVVAQKAPIWPPNGNDIPDKFTPPVDANADYIKREVMIPMRDGTKLYTVIVIPKDATNAPIVLTRTPYNAAGRAKRSDSASMLATLPLADEIFVRNGYIRVYQDIRGKYGSEGGYVTTRPVVGALNDSKVDHTTDAYDTIDWLVNKANLPQSNGKVGMIGSSYEGFTVVMALLHPHPALKVAAPQSPMVDGWMGDDWFHYGAFRLANIAWLGSQTGYKGAGKAPPTGGYDDYDNFREIGSAGEWAKKSGYDQLPYWNRMSMHPAYDEFWSGQALDKMLAKSPSSVPTIWEQGLWDQEDMWGAIHSYQAIEPHDKNNNLNYLVMGPWRHSQINADGFSLGPLLWNGDTSAQYRHDMLKPFFDQYLLDGAAKANISPVTIYNTGENHWDHFSKWPLSCDTGCASKPKALYLAPGAKLSFQAPAASGPGYEEYVSDPAKPVPYLPRPIKFSDRKAWTTWLVHDQRFVDDRPDVLSFTTEPLTEPLRISGVPEVNLVASTSGTDSDANQPLLYKFALPTTNHVFQPGHRVMVQVQSSLFPLYDRNPQTFVPNIFFAKPGDYQKATQRVYTAPGTASFINLPVTPAGK